ncbi:MAG: hypothetical protein B7Z62_03800, partial [Deltaproteobacteria bacterium 37-65-8]
DAAAARSTRHTLLYILEGILRALHPITPFVTEEIWQEVAPRLGLTRASILERPYPCIEPHPEQLSGTALEDFQAHTRRYPPESTQINTLIIAVSEVRSLRSQLGVSPARAVPLLIEGSMDDPGMFGGVATMLQALCRIERIDVLPADATPPPSAAAPLFGAVVHIPLAGLIDNKISKQVSKVPLLGDIPILGALFRSTRYQNNETELVMLVTPKIIRPYEKGATPPLPTDRVTPEEIDPSVLKE